ncbi:hypothetical protein [Nocardia jejuensis]|uniref:hypothetical protein n=1 Tax=Nocardia jejuensis TaxID=328049 RepID=UPI00083458D7|nr:hypothetical protein [Nocardia jejuensis]
MGVYTFQLPNFSSDADVAERTLRGLDTVSAVNVDNSAESITVDSSLTYGETLDVIRQSGIAAK